MLICLDKINHYVFSYKYCESVESARWVQENEHFALAWLRATVALAGGDEGACDAAELHRHYAACCAKLARKPVPAAHFPRLVR